MSFRHAIDHDHQVITIALFGDVDGEELLEAAGRMVELNRNNRMYRHVWDGLEIEMLDVDYKSLLRLVAFIKAEMQPRLIDFPGAAVFLRRQVDYVLLKTIHLMLGAPEPVVIIRDRESANKWLEKDSPPNAPFSRLPP
jgi:hypothetical protein